MAARPPAGRRARTSPGGSSPPACSASGSSPRSCSTRSTAGSSPSSPRASASPSTSPSSPSRSPPRSASASPSASSPGSVVLRQAARFYIEIVRGIPILVLLFYIAFVAVPALVAGWNALAGPLGLGAPRDPRRLAHVARDHRADARLRRLHRRGLPRRHPVGRPRPDRGGQGARPDRLAALPPDRPPAGAAHHPAAARQRLHRADQGQRARLGPRRRRHHPARQGLRRRLLPLLRDLQRRRLPLPGDDRRPLAGAARLERRLRARRALPPPPPAPAARSPAFRPRFVLWSPRGGRRPDRRRKQAAGRLRGTHPRRKPTCRDLS